MKAKKLGLAVFGLVLAIILAVSTTFAWFSINIKPQIDNFNFNVTTGTDGLYFLITKPDEPIGDKKHRVYYYQDDFVNALGIGENGKFNENFRYVDTTPKRDDLGNIILTENKISFISEQNKEYLSNDTAVNNLGSYLSFDIHFRAKTQYGVKLTTNSSVVSNRPVLESPLLPKAWAEFPAGLYADQIIAKDAVIQTRSANAIRFAFVTDDKVRIWEPNKEQGLGAGSRNLAVDYKNKITGNKMNHDLDESKSNIPNYVLNNDNEIFIEENITTLIDSGNGYFDGKISVNIWLEGWDSDCLNTILNDFFTINLKFKGVITE